MKKQNKVMVGALALLVMGTSSLAYFTDRTESNFNAKAGNLCLTHVDSQSDLLNMAPGDLRDISFEYKNEGTLAMDTRVTYMLSYELEDGKLGNTEGKVVTLLDGEDELVTKEIGDGVAKVTVNEATIQGTTDKVGEVSLKKNLKLKLHESVVNDFQEATFHIDVVIEGKQNKNDAQWEEINTERITVRADELNVVRQSACNVGEEDPDVERIFAVYDGDAKVVYDKNPNPSSLKVTVIGGSTGFKEIDLSSQLNNMNDIKLEDLDVEGDDAILILKATYDNTAAYETLSSGGRTLAEITEDYNNGKPAFVINEVAGGMEEPDEEPED